MGFLLKLNEKNLKPLSTPRIQRQESLNGPIHRWLKPSDDIVCVLARAPLLGTGHTRNHANVPNGRCSVAGAATIAGSATSIEESIFSLTASSTSSSSSSLLRFFLLFILLFAKLSAFQTKAAHSLSLMAGYFARLQPDDCTFLIKQSFYLLI